MVTTVATEIDDGNKEAKNEPIKGDPMRTLRRQTWPVDRQETSFVG